jgi:2-C-methyl-D-erythritol 4-phosphate cytidylyltransferase
MARGDRLGAVIVAAGISQRMGGINKLFAPLRGKPLIAWAVDTCEQCDLIQQVVLVLNDRDLSRGRRLRESRGWGKVAVCVGGPRRQDSVKEGLRQVQDCRTVMIHDGARPFLTVNLIEAGLKVAREVGAAVAVVPLKDTIKLTDDGGSIKDTLPRNRLWAAQTPQMFDLDVVMRAYQSLKEEVTDDAAAVALLGQSVHVYAGDPRNIKVTTIEDLALARIIARRM